MPQQEGVTAGARLRPVTSRIVVTQRGGQTSTAKNSPSKASTVTEATSADLPALRGCCFTVTLRLCHPFAHYAPTLPGASVPGPQLLKE